MDVYSITTPKSMYMSAKRAQTKGKWAWPLKSPLLLKFKAQTWEWWLTYDLGKLCLPLKILIRNSINPSYTLDCIRSLVLSRQRLNFLADPCHVVTSKLRLYLETLKIEALQTWHLSRTSSGQINHASPKATTPNSRRCRRDPRPDILLHRTSLSCTRALPRLIS